MHYARIAPMKNNQINMTEGAIFSKLMSFSVPLILTGLLQLLFNAADTVVVGRFAGDNSLAAVGATNALVNLLVNLFVGLSIGVNVVAANFYGAGQKERLVQTVHTAMLLSLYSGVALTVIGVVGAKKILLLMQAPKEVLELSTLYLQIYFGGIIATMLFNFGSALLRAKGDTKRPLYILLTAGFINVILNLIFVICFGMGVAGVGFATVISQSFAAVFIIAILLREEDEFRLSLKKLAVDREIFIKIVKIGVPAGVQGIIFSFSNIIIQSSVNTFGAVTIAGNSAAQSIEGFVYVAMNCCAQGTLTFTSQNIGAGKIDRVKKMAVQAELLEFLLGLILGNLVVFFGRSILRIYSENPAVIEAGMTRLKIICTIYFMCGVMDCFANIIRGMGYSLVPMLITLTAVCGSRIIWLFTVFRIPRFHSCSTIYLSYPISWMIAILCLLISLVSIFRKDFRQNQTTCNG